MLSGFVLAAPVPCASTVSRCDKNKQQTQCQLLFARLIFAYVSQISADNEVRRGLFGSRGASSQLSLGARLTIPPLSETQPREIYIPKTHEVSVVCACAQPQVRRVCCLSVPVFYQPLAGILYLSAVPLLTLPPPPTSCLKVGLVSFSILGLV